MTELLVPETIEIIAVNQPNLDQNPAAIYLSTLRPSGRRTMHQSLNKVADMLRPGANAFSFPWHSLRYQHTAAIAARLAEEYKPATANKMIKAVRRVLKEAWRLGQMESENYRRAVEVQGIKSETLPAGRALSAGELVALMNTCAQDVTPAGTRDAAMIAVLYAAGLRRSELVKLTLADYNSVEASLVIRSGKGGKDRLCYLESGAAAALADWLTLRGEGAGSLFCSINKGGRLNLAGAMTDQAVLAMLRKRGEAAGVKSFSPHDLRRTFISDMLDAGADIATVQKLAGHASVTTTARYDRRGEVAKKKAASLLHVPYQRRHED